MSQYNSSNGYTVKSCSNNNCSYDMQPDCGYKPQPDCGYKPQPDCGYKPQPDCGYKPQPDCGCKPQPDCGCKPQPQNCCKYSEIACEKCKQAAMINEKASEFAKAAKEAEKKAEYYKQILAQECEKAGKLWDKHRGCCEESIALIKEAKQYLIKEEECFGNNCSKDCPSDVCDCLDDCNYCKNTKCNNYCSSKSSDDCNYNCR